MNNRPHIPQTRSSQYRPMTQMNGDFLTQLKKPICSELNADFKGTLRAREAHCRQQVGLWYKDQQFLLRKLNKQEEDMYALMLEVQREKRRLEKEGHVRRESWSRCPQQVPADDCKTDALDLGLPLVAGAAAGDHVTAADDYVTAAGDHVTAAGDHVTADKAAAAANRLTPEETMNLSEKKLNEVDIKQNNKKKSFDSYIQQQHNHTATSAKHMLQAPAQTSSHDRRKQATLSGSSAILKTRKSVDTLPQVKAQNYIATEVAPLKTTVVESKHVTTKLIRPMPRISEGEPLSCRPNTKEKSFASEPLSKESTFIYDHAPVGSTAGHAPVGDSDVRERVILQTPYHRPDDSSVNRLYASADGILQSHANYDDVISDYDAANSPNTHSRDVPTRSQSADIYESSATHARKRQSVGMILINRQMNGRRQLQLKQILDQEPPLVYDRSENGELVPTRRTFKRKSFQMPTLNEVRQRQKLLLELREKQQTEVDLMQRFLSKVDEEKGKQQTEVDLMQNFLSKVDEEKGKQQTEVKKCKQEAEVDLIQRFLSKVDKTKGQPVNSFRPRRQATKDELVLKEDASAGMVSLERIAAVFNHRNVAESLPDDVEPGSIAAMRQCSYLRPIDFDAKPARA